MYVEDKSKLDMDAARKKIETSLSNNFYYMATNGPVRISLIELLPNNIWQMICAITSCFASNGVPRMTLVCSERFTTEGLKEDFYDEAWNHFNVQRPEHGNATLPIERPKQYELTERIRCKAFREKCAFCKN